MYILHKKACMTSHFENVLGLDGVRSSEYNHRGDEKVESEKLTKSNQSVIKALQLLEIMAADGQEMRLQDIAAKAAIPPSTALRMISTLNRCGYVGQNPDTQKYYISYKLCSIASHISEANALVRLARPYMELLGRRCRQTITLATEQNNKALFVSINEDYVQSVRVEHRVGARSPLHTAAVGKLFLFNRSLPEIEQYFEQTEKVTFTPYTITTLEGLKNSLRSVEVNGFSLNDEEGTLGARCVARPLYDFSGKICAAMGVSGPSVHMTDDYIREFMPDLIRATSELSRELGYQGQQTPPLHINNL